MYHFFVSPTDISGHDIYIRGADHNHIKNVLRMKKGETLSVSDGVSENEYRCHIEGFEEDAVHLRLDFIKEADTELPVEICLLQGLPKADKMEFIIQKAVELGIDEVIPVATGRSIVKLDEKKAEAKVRRWQGIAEAAAKQSMRNKIPGIGKVMNFKEALEYTRDMDVKLIPYELAKDFDRTREVIGSIGKGKRVALFIGPEGGFEEEEVTCAEAEGFIPITLGKRILRTETAAMVVLSWLLYILEQ